MYVILGATGNTGSVVARKLLDKGKRVRVVGRDNQKLAPFVNRGADAFAADVHDTDALSRAFAGAQGVYALIPPDMSSPDFRAHQARVTESIAEALLRLDFKGQQTQELLGPREVTYAEAAKMIGTATGKPDLAYMQLPDEQVIEAMKGMGISRNMAQLLCEMSAAINSGYMKPREPRSEKNTTATTFETFVRELFLPAYRGQATSA